MHSRTKLYFRKTFTIVFSAMLLFVIGCGNQQATSDQVETNDSSTQQTSDKSSTEEESKKLEFSLSHFMSINHNQHAHVMAPFIEEIREATNERIDITIFPGAALGTPQAQFELAATGVADMAFGVHGYTSGQFRATSVIQLPFMGNSAVSSVNTLFELTEKFPEIAEEHAGTKILWLTTTSPAEIITKDKEIKTLEDIKDLKLRTPSAEATAMLEALGAVPVSIPLNETFEAIDKGVVDGALTPINGLIEYNLGDVTNYITKTDLYNSTFFVVMNEDSYNKIVGPDKETFDKAIGLPMFLRSAEDNDIRTEESWEYARQNGITINELDEAEFNRWKEALMGISEEWVKELEERGIPGQELLDEARRLSEINNSK